MTSLALILAASVFFRYEPAAPTVGDPVRIEYEIEQGARIVPEESGEYEIVSGDDRTIVVRSFRPGIFTVAGVVERDGVSEPFRGPEIEVRSVLGENDSLEPAPLKPPVVPPAERLPRIAIACAAAAAFLAWAAVLLWKGKVELESVPAPGFDAVFISRLEALRRRPFEQQAVAEVAELTRDYLARRDPSLARELTTTELIARLQESPDARLIAPVTDVLREGDLAKFSPWGSHFDSMSPLVDRAEELAR